MSNPAEVTFFRLSVACPRLIGVEPFDPKNAQTQPDVWIVGDIPAASARHAVKLWWNRGSHWKAALLARDGTVLRKARLKRSDLQARELRPDDAPRDAAASARHEPASPARSAAEPRLDLSAPAPGGLESL